MLSFLFLTGSAVLGVCLMRRLVGGILDLIEQFLWGTTVGWILTALSVYLVARRQGLLTPRLVLWATIIVWVVAVLLVAVELRRRNDSLCWPVWQRYTGLAIVLLVLAPIYWRLLSVQIFFRGDGGVYSGSAGNDLNFHAALISSFRYGQNFPPTYTLLPPEPLLYPFMPDFHAAILMAGGLSLRSAMILTALLLGAVIAGLFYSFALRVARSARTATLATLLFLLNGGFGFINFFRDWWRSDKSLIQFWNTLRVNYANFSEQGIHWNNIVADMMVPQRTSLFGLSIGLMIFTTFAIVWQRWHRGEGVETDRNEPRSLTLMFIAGGLAGILPWFHTHTYISVGVVSVVLFGLRPRREWFAFWAPAILLAAPQLIALATHANGAGVVRPFFGWLGHDDPFFPLYLLRNFGLPLLLAIPALWVAPREWRKFYLAFLVLLIFTFVIVFSPNIFDNGKPIYYWHALNSVLVAAWLTKLAAEHKQRVLAACLAFLSIVTALIVFHSETIASTRVFTDEEILAAAFVRDHTPPHSLFLTAPALNSPVLSLSGRPVLRSATAWLWSHGYEFRERENDVRRIYAGSVDAAELLRYYKVDYIYLGDAERSDEKADSAFFERNFPAIYRSATITIYDAHKLRDSASPGTNLAPRELAARIERDPFSLVVEFPRTSFFVYRLYRASFGRMPRRQEFFTAMELLGRGVFIGAPGWEDQLEKNRSSLLIDWMNSSEFRQRYDGKSNADFVAALLKNSGADFGATQRDALVKDLDAQSQTRRAALLKIAEDRNFYAREYNNAYVLVHFFGYLRRNPDDAPDYDLKGFNFWRDRLNSWGDYRTISRAFIESDEYRNLDLAP